MFPFLFAFAAIWLLISVSICVVGLTCAGTPTLALPADMSRDTLTSCRCPFRRDPVPYMGDLGSYDLQIPESWSTGRTDSVSLARGVVSRPFCIDLTAAHRKTTGHRRLQPFASSHYPLAKDG